MKAVVLAAGCGTRLSDGDPGLPKPLVPLAGIPLIAHTLRALAEVEVDRVAVVTGYSEAVVRSVVFSWANSPVTFVSNPLFDRGASYSLAAAKAWCGQDPTLVLMCDHVFSPDFARVLVNSAAEDPTRDVSLVAADRSPRPAAYVAEATKLAIDGAGFVTGIGKSLSSWDALDAGAFVCAPSVWDAVEQAPDDCELSEIFGYMARERGLKTVDVSGHFWYDVDTIDDLKNAEHLLAERSGPSMSG